MPSPGKKTLKDLHLASNVGELNKLADPGLPVDRNANPSPYIKSADKVYLRAQGDDLEGDEENAYVYYMRYFNIICLIKKSNKYTGNKKYFDNLLGKTKIIKSIERAEALQGSLHKRYDKLKAQKEADKKAQEEAKQKEEEDKKKLASIKGKHGSGTDSDSGFDSDIDSLLNGNGILSSSSDVYQKLKVNHNSILAPKTSENSNGTLISGFESPRSSTDGVLCVSAQDLYNMMTVENESKIMILDCRPHAMFVENRIKSSCCISIPAELLDEGVSVGSIERRLPEVTRKIWKRRGEKEFVILMDESTKIADITPECRIQRLKDVIFTFDSYSSLKREPLFLDGGFHSWLWHYPSLALKAELPKVQSQPKAVTPVDLSSLDYPELPEEKISSPQLPLSPETGPINNSLLYPVIPTAGVENVSGTFTNPKGSTDSDKSLPPSSMAPLQPSANLPPPGLQHGENAPSSGFSPAHKAGPKPGIPPTGPSSQTGFPLPGQSDIRSSQIGSPRMDSLNMPSSQPGAPLLRPGVAPFLASGPPPSVGIAPQAVPHAVIPNVAGPRAPGSLPNATVPRPSSQPIFQPSIPGSAPPMVPITQPSSFPSATVPKPSSQPGVPFQSPSSIPSPRPGIPPSQPTSSQSTSPSNMSVPGVQPASVNSPSSVASQIHSVAPLQVTPTVSTSSSTAGPQRYSQSSMRSQGPGVVPPSVPGQVPHQVAQSVQPGHQPQVPPVSQVPRGDRQVPGQSSLSTAQPRQVTSTSIPGTDPRNNASGSQNSVNASHVPPPGSVHHSPRSQPRSNSSPNLAKISDQGSSGPKTPIIDRLSKPDIEQTGPARPVFNRSAKPLSANQLDSFNPSYGGLGTGLTGLRNLGNTCYMNSVVQCLSSVAPLAAYFISGAYREDINRSNRDGTRGELAENFSVLVRVMHSGQFKFVSPGEFKRTVGKFKSQFSGYDQQDSQELLAFLMDGLQEDLNKVKTKPYLKAPADDLDPQTSATIAWENHKKRNASIMVELFDGLFMSTVKCMVCSKESRTFDTFSNLTLPLPSHASRCTLQDCLALFTKPEKMSGDDKWFCPKCQQRREASKTIQIWRLPAILIIHLKRFQYEGMWRQKLQTNVSFPMTQLDMSNFVVGPKSTPRYNLHAVSNHYGTMHGGHYTAFGKSVYDKKWYKFDDQYVTEMSSRDVSTSAGYLLFYTSFDFQPPKYLIKS
ncbi:Ubiquitin carboxyl-terminal hydrolase 8 [Desmophyllum pertusum]|uniref:ubiquitinyl hydrolase 1 n=1 Tax=Desmophyllum pertusum TaxID=174260 RepID=A0A9X0DBV7_9CNID|nr:Ubiquitin carboxyl-terminal hydrolase 8 [Desmophyllum pertusum]